VGTRQRRTNHVTFVFEELAITQMEQRMR
jgi:hypothetical protein